MLGLVARSLDNRGIVYFFYHVRLKRGSRRLTFYWPLPSVGVEGALPSVPDDGDSEDGLGSLGSDAELPSVAAGDAAAEEEPSSEDAGGVTLS